MKGPPAVPLDKVTSAAAFAAVVTTVVNAHSGRSREGGDFPGGVRGGVVAKKGRGESGREEERKRKIEKERERESLDAVVTVVIVV
jgi:hypothetical protein